MGFVTTLETVYGKEFYKSVDEDGGMNGTSFSPTFKSEVVNIVNRTKEERMKYRAWLRRVQKVSPWKEEEFKHLMEISRYPYVINLFLNKKSIAVKSMKEAVKICLERQLDSKKVKTPFGNK